MIARRNYFTIDWNTGWWCLVWPDKTIICKCHCFQMPELQTVNTKMTYFLYLHLFMHYVILAACLKCKIIPIATRSACGTLCLTVEGSAISTSLSHFNYESAQKHVKKTYHKFRRIYIYFKEVAKNSIVHVSMFLCWLYRYLS